MDAESNKAPEIEIPENFKPPEGQDGGKTFEVVDTWEVKPDGKHMCLLKCGDHAFDKPDYDEERKPARESAPNYKAAAGNILSAMDDSGAGGGY